LRFCFMGAASWLQRARRRDAAALRLHFLRKVFMYQRFGNRREPLSGVKIEVAPCAFIDSIARRFNKVVQSSDILTDVRRHQYFVPKGERRRRQSIAAQKRQRP
jgi:ribosomal protein S21